MSSSNYPREVTVGPHALQGIVAVPDSPEGLIIFAHGSGSGRLSPRNNHVAAALQLSGFATILLDLLTTEEELDRANVFDINLLATRLEEVVAWIQFQPDLCSLPIGLFGASTGGGAALVAAARLGPRVQAVVSRGGRPDLAGAALPLVEAPTLLLVGSLDLDVLRLNRWALEQLRCQKALTVIPGASHLFEERGTLDEVVEHAIHWFRLNLARAKAPAALLPFPNRRAAGQALARALTPYKGSNPLILALPRGGVPIGYEIAAAIGGELDVLLVRKLGAPGHEELGIGAVVDGEHPQIVLNQKILAQVVLPSGYVHNEAQRQLIELERRRITYLGGRAPIPAEGRTVIVVDDGIATGGTMKAALQGVRQKRPARLVLAVPVAPSDSLTSMAEDCDEIVCLQTPEPFYAVGAHYEDFTQTTDDEVKQLLSAASGLEPASAI